MARIAGVDLPRDKRIVVALTYIYGIGDSTAKKICADSGVSEDIRSKDLTPENQENSAQKLINIVLKVTCVVKLA